MASPLPRMGPVGRLVGGVLALLAVCYVLAVTFEAPQVLHKLLGDAKPASRNGHGKGDDNVVGRSG